MRYGSVCSGIEAASVAWEPLGWEPQWFAEIEAFPSAVLAHRFPSVPNLGDMTKVVGHELTADIDLLVGGTPCQSFSIAGLRGGLSDERGNLALEFCRIAQAKRPRWVVWENVPGVLSSDGGRAFGSVVGALADIGYRLAWRVLDAQYFGVPQRRRRVFLIGHLGGPRNRAAKVLFEPAREDGDRSEVVTRAKDASASRRVVPKVAQCLTTRTGSRYDPGTETLPIDERGIRCLTPLETERLQGFPDGWTDIPGGSPTTRRHATGNSMAVPVMRWIGERIQLVEESR